jgi:hypothetical protein
MSPLIEQTSTDLTAPAATPEPVVPPVMKLPDVRTISHARKMAKILFGPLARVWVREHAHDKRTVVSYEVGVERAGHRKVFAIGEKLQEAMQAAVQSTSEYEHRHGNLPKNVMPMFSAVQKPVLTRRMKWINDYIDYASTEAEEYEKVLQSFGLDSKLTYCLPEEDAKEIKTLVSHLRPNDVKGFQPPVSGTPEAVKTYISELRQAVARG